MADVQAANTRQSVIITGCTPGGIGNSLAREFHRQGLRVFATARSREAIGDLDALGIETLSLEVDSEESVQGCRAEVEQRLAGRGLDYLVNNAGRNYTVAALDVTLDEARETFETNFFGVIRMCQVFAPLLIQAKGTIVQIGSVAGIVPYVFGSVYNASKAAVHSFSDTLRVELAPFGVRVTTVITGGVQSRIARNVRTLPPTSYYQPLAAEFRRRQTHSQESAMPNDAYARSVVTQVLYGAAPWRWLTYLWPWRTPGMARHAMGKNWIWEGRRSNLIWFVSMGWTWWGFLGRVLTRMFNLNKLRREADKAVAAAEAAAEAQKKDA